MVARISCKVVDKLAIGKYLLFLSVMPLKLRSFPTARYRRWMIFTGAGAATPVTATVFRTLEADYGWKCTICGYIYEGRRGAGRLPVSHLPRAAEQICKALSNEDGMLGHFRKRMVQKRDLPLYGSSRFSVYQSMGKGPKWKKRVYNLFKNPLLTFFDDRSILN